MYIYFNLILFILISALLRHMGYLGFILFITLFCYCAGIIYACMNPTKYGKKDYKMIIMEENEEKQKLIMNNFWIIKKIENYWRRN